VGEVDHDPELIEAPHHAVPELGEPEGAVMHADAASGRVAAVPGELCRPHAEAVEHVEQLERLADRCEALEMQQHPVRLVR